MIPPRFLNAIAWLALMLEEHGRLDHDNYEAARMNASMTEDVWFPPVRILVYRGPIDITLLGWRAPT